MAGHRREFAVALLAVTAVGAAFAQAPRPAKPAGAGFEAELRDRAFGGRVVAADQRVWTCAKGRCRAPASGPALAACRALAAKAGPVLRFGGLAANDLAACNTPATAAATPRLQASALARVQGMQPALQAQLGQRLQRMEDLRARIERSEREAAARERTEQDRRREQAIAAGRLVRHGQGEDCDDTRRDVHPNAAEVCDYRDNNCDGQIDEGQRLAFFLDADGDGHGDPAQRVDACPHDQTRAAAEGRWLVLVGNDCDDTDARRWQRCE